MWHTRSPRNGGKQVSGKGMQPPYMIVTDKGDGTYTIWHQDRPEGGKQKLLRTVQANTRVEAEQIVRAWERVHGVAAIWRETGDVG